MMHILTISMVFLLLDPSIRRYAATKMIDEEVHPSQVQQILGHKDIATTMRYIGMGDQNLEEALKTITKGDIDYSLSEEK